MGDAPGGGQRTPPRAWIGSRRAERSAPDDLGHAATGGPIVLHAGVLPVERLHLSRRLDRLPQVPQRAVGARQGVAPKAPCTAGVAAEIRNGAAWDAAG